MICKIWTARKMDNVWQISLGPQTTMCFRLWTFDDFPNPLLSHVFHLGTTLDFCGWLGFPDAAQWRNFWEYVGDPRGVNSKDSLGATLAAFFVSPNFQVPSRDKHFPYQPTSRHCWRWGFSFFLLVGYGFIRLEGKWIQDFVLNFVEAGLSAGNLLLQNGWLFDDHLPTYHWETIFASWVRSCWSGLISWLAFWTGQAKTPARNYKRQKHARFGSGATEPIAMW